MAILGAHQQSSSRRRPWWWFCFLILCSVFFCLGYISAHRSLLLLAQEEDFSPRARRKAQDGVPRNPQQQEYASPTTESSAIPENPPTAFDGVRARAFRYWNEDRSVEMPLPCFEVELNWAELQCNSSSTGFLFVKPVKTGSSTAAGVNLRIARNVAHRQRRVNVRATWYDPDFNASLATPHGICKARSGHVVASQSYPHRDPSRSYLWSIVREPSSRILSQFFFFYVSRAKKEPSDESFALYLQTAGFTKNHYLDKLSLTPYLRKKNATARFVNQIMDSYDFIGVTERMEESLVALSMLLRVPLSDVMYLKAKGSGGFDDGGLDKKCTYIQPTFVSPGMQSALDSDWWRDKSRWDRALHLAANRSLDLTIDKLGRERFNEKLEQYKAALKRAQQLCLPRPDMFPCSPTGDYIPPDRTKCLYGDSGCGSDCLDEVADELQLWE